MYDLWYRFRAKSKWRNKIHSNNDIKRWGKRNHYSGYVITKNKSLEKGLVGIKKALINMRKEWVNIGVDKLDIISYIDSVPGYEPYNNCP
jgi:hypothetical protein